MRLTPLAWLSSSIALAGAALAQGPQAMFIESCNLGCSSGAGGSQVSCAITAVHVNAEVRVRFSRAVDPASLDAVTFSILDVANGSSPPGARFVDPTDDHVVVFRPALTFDAQGAPQFGLQPNRAYLIVVPGAAQGDPPPRIASTDSPPLDNQSRMSCTVVTSLGVLDPSVPYCPGTSGCPCGNAGDGQRGCASSTAPQGIGLLALGTASVASDDVRLVKFGFPPGSAVFFQGTQRENGGNGTPFGDGLLCAGGTLLRLRSIVGGNALQVIPSGSHPPISAQGLVPPAGGTRTYQLWYRDTGAFCTPATFNTSNAIEISWAP